MQKWWLTVNKSLLIHSLFLMTESISYIRECRLHFRRQLSDILKFKTHHTRSTTHVFCWRRWGFYLLHCFGKAEMLLGTATNVVYVAWYCWSMLLGTAGLCCLVLRPQKLTLLSMLLGHATKEMLLWTATKKENVVSNCTCRDQHFQQCDIVAHVGFFWALFRETKYFYFTIISIVIVA